jgi:biotin carboxyl carrier protein
MKFWALMGSGKARRELDIDVQLEGGKLILDTGDESLVADVARLPDGESYSLIIDGKSYEVAIEGEEGELSVNLDGRLFDASVRSPFEKTLREVRKSGPVSSASVVKAPMPGLIVDLKVGPGERVTVGQPLAIIEAMKMQNELAAESDGEVKTIHVETGQSVEAGKELITLGPVEGE